jgi:hypothetical protein
LKTVQSEEEQKRTDALGEKLCVLLKDRPRHRALLTNECTLNHSNTTIPDGGNTVQSTPTKRTDDNNNQIQQQEDETSYTRELIQIYGQPIVPSFHKCFNYQLSNTHYGYRTLRRLLNCEILKKFVKVSCYLRKAEFCFPLDSDPARVELARFLFWQKKLFFFSGPGLLESLPTLTF